MGELKPAVVVVENVTGLASSSRGEGFSVAMCELNQLGYAVDVLVTVVPQEKLLARCHENFQEGLRPVIITTKNRVQATEQMLEIGGLGDRVMVQSGETFTGTNVEEVAGYAGPGIRTEIGKLIRSYNRRISEVEVDQSLKIGEHTWVREID